MEQSVKAIPVILASHMGAVSSPSCSISHPPPCYWSWESSGGWPKGLCPAAYLAHLDKDPGS